MNQFQSVKGLELQPSHVIVCGGRDYNGRKYVFENLDRLSEELRFYWLAHGGASGADALASEWAYDRGVNQTCYKAQWDTYGRSAGPVRNLEMFRQVRPKHVIAFPGGKGTKHMMSVALAGGATVIELTGV